MFGKCLIIAWRHLRLHWLSSVVNVAMLSVALAYALLALTYVRQELTYDAFHEKAARIFQVNAHFPHPRLGLTVPHQPDPDIGPALVQSHPSILSGVRIRKSLMDVGLTIDAREEFTPVVCADPEILQLFDFQLAVGEADSALSSPSSVVLTETAARRLFASNDPLGRIVELFVRQYEMSGFDRYTLEPHPFTVTGVLRDLPPNSSLTFDLLVPYAAAGPLDVYGIRGLYVELAPGAGVEEVSAALPQFVADQLGREPSEYALSLQSLRSVHFDERVEHDQLGSSPAGRALHLYILAGMGFLVLAAASLAYANLSTARTLSRVREVGVRKTVGATPRQLWLQFWRESLLVSLLSLCLGIGLAWVGAGFFGELVDRRLDIFGNLPIDLVWFLGLALATGLAAGGYPALVLSRVPPVAIVRGTPTDRGRRSFSRAMMVLQFGVAIFLIVCVTTMGDQFVFMQERYLGFDADHVLAVDLLNNDHPAVVPMLRRELQGAKGIVAVAGADQAPATSYISAKWKRDSDELHFSGFRVGQGFLRAMGLQLASGRWFSAERDETSGAVVVNEAFVRHCGWDDPVGRVLRELPRPGRLEKWSPTIVGVVRDFHNRDVQRPIGPAVLELQSRHRGFKRLIVRLAAGEVEMGTSAVRQAWQRVTGDAPFHGRILGQLLDGGNADTERWTRLVRTSSALTLLIAGLSVFGLAALEANRRTREVGIRKVLGAATPQIVKLLLGDFSGLVLVANLFAWPGAYLAMKLWLGEFAYHIPLGPWHFLLAGLVALAIASLTATSHAVQASLTNPVDALRQ